MRPQTITADNASRALEERLFQTRRLSLELAAPLSAEDMTVQAMDDASPTKWHLAHVTWFFETFILSKHLPGYQVFDESFNYCFNSYYESQGPRQPRPRRGLLTRPASERVLAYRHYVDDALARLCAKGISASSQIARLMEIGINHEQQHQELLLTDILALFAANPLRPAYRQPAASASLGASEPIRWLEFTGGIAQIGHDGKTFAWDNELPRHDALIHPFALADRLVSNGEWLEFINDGGYSTATLWLSEGWDWVQREQVAAPLYWRDGENEFTLAGRREIDWAAPVAHVSFFEADAFARWAGARLPTEGEWEDFAASADPMIGNQLDLAGAVLPRAGGGIFGDVWEWTQSAFASYPGFAPAAGAVGEYNGKFMCGQFVLKGASCATPRGHSRASYRNFFPPAARWQFTGLRLARDA